MSIVHWGDLHTAGKAGRPLLHQHLKCGHGFDHCWSAPNAANRSTRATCACIPAPASRREKDKGNFRTNAGGYFNGMIAKATRESLTCANDMGSAAWPPGAAHLARINELTLVVMEAMQSDLTPMFQRVCIRY
jgi:hypothetical protein